MGTLQERFQHLDSRFLTYLENVLSRLPVEVKESILGNADFQLIADDGFLNTCMLRRTFTAPVKNLAYINTKILREPGHRILLAIASQIAFYVCSKEKSEVDCREAEELLKEWGFGVELDAVRHEEVLAKTEGYKIGYQWARNQDKDYLLQHFGLYFDEWKTKGSGKPTKEALRAIEQYGTASILEEISRIRTAGAPAAKTTLDATAPLTRQAVFAGIMTALKEIELLEQFSPEECEIASA